MYVEQLQIEHTGVCHEYYIVVSDSQSYFILFVVSHILHSTLSFSHVICSLFQPNRRHVCEVTLTQMLMLCSTMYEIELVVAKGSSIMDKTSI